MGTGDGVVGPVEEGRIGPGQWWAVLTGIRHLSWSGHGGARQEGGERRKAWVRGARTDLGRAGPVESAVCVGVNPFCKQNM